MSNPGIFSSRIKTLKLQLAYALLLLFCILFYWLDGQEFHLPWWAPQFLPYKSLAEACLTTLLVSYIYEAWIRRESQAELHEAILSENTLKKVIGDDAAARLTRAGFQRMLQNDGFGDEMFQYFSKHPFSADRRRYDSRTEITLLPIDSDTTFSYDEDQKNYYFNSRHSLSYQKPLRTPVIWFECVLSRAELHDSTRRDSTEWRWFVPQHRYFDSIDESFFRVFDVELDGRPCEVKSRHENGHIKYFVEVPEHLHKQDTVLVQCKIDIKIRKRAPFIFTDIVNPVKNVIISLDVALVPVVSEVDAVPMFSSVSQAKIDYMPSFDNRRKITVTVNGWSIPDSGVAFVWRHP